MKLMTLKPFATAALQIRLHRFLSVSKIFRNDKMQKCKKLFHFQILVAKLKPIALRIRNASIKWTAVIPASVIPSFTVPMACVSCVRLENCQILKVHT